MHVSQKISLDCGVQSIEPEIPLGFFPLKKGGFIILENSKSSCEYLHFEEVASYLSSFSQKNNRELIQIKINQQDATIGKCKPYSNLSLPQFNWIIKNSDILISNNPYSCAIASALNIPTIQIHKTFPEKSFKAIWGTEKKENFINNKKLFAETIVKKALKILKEDTGRLKQIKPVFCGDNFHIKCIEVVPDFEKGKPPIQNENINIRADYFYNQENISQLIHLNKCNLVTKKPINPQLINNKIARNNLLSINFEVTKETTEKDLESLFSLNVDTNLFCKDADNISSIRLNLIDYKINLEETILKKDLDTTGNICDNTLYKSSKILISKGKHYSSKAKWKKQQPLQKNFFETIVNEPDFWQESEHFKLFNIKNHG